MQNRPYALIKVGQPIFAYSRALFKYLNMSSLNSQWEFGICHFSTWHFLPMHCDICRLSESSPSRKSTLVFNQDLIHRWLAAYTWKISTLQLSPLLYFPFHRRSSDKGVNGKKGRIKYDIGTTTTVKNPQTSTGQVVWYCYYRRKSRIVSVRAIKPSFCTVSF